MASLSENNSFNMCMDTDPRPKKNSSLTYLSVSTPHLVPICHLNILLNINELDFLGDYDVGYQSDLRHILSFSISTAIGRPTEVL